MDARRLSEDVEDMASGEKSELPIAHEPPVQAQDESLSRTKSRPSNTIARIASHITTRSIRDPGPPPDGGFVAWTQVACAWLAIFNSWGFVNSFGAFQPYYESILPESSSTISWIGTRRMCANFTIDEH
jgi:hypothetical protein